MNTYKLIKNIIPVDSKNKIITIEGNSSTDRLCFIVERFYYNIDLSKLKCIIKTENEKGITDVIPCEFECDDNIITVYWNIKASSAITEGKLNVQLQFHSLDYSIIWQTDIAEFYVEKSITADKVITDNPTIFEDFTKNIGAIKQDIDAKYNTIENSVKKIDTMSTELDNLFDTVLPSITGDAMSVNGKKVDDNKNDISCLWTGGKTKSEITNAVAGVYNAMDWKASVNTYNDILTTYPNPKDGWVVNVNDTDITYRFTGTEWVAISANSIPLVTTEIDGIMSKNDKLKLDSMAIIKTTEKAMYDDVISTRFNALATFSGNKFTLSLKFPPAVLPDKFYIDFIAPENYVNSNIIVFSNQEYSLLSFGSTSTSLSDNAFIKNQPVSLYFSDNKFYLVGSNTNMLGGIEYHNYPTTESGFWTPELSTYSGGFAVIDTSTTKCSYIKMGNIVFLFGRVTLSSKGTLQNNILSLKGLPFEASPLLQDGVILNWYNNMNLPTDCIGLSPQIVRSGITFYYHSKTTSPFLMPSHITDKWDFEFSAFYSI